MGSFLDTPKTEKETERFSNGRLQGAVSSMQGWRIEMEVSPQRRPHSRWPTLHHMPVLATRPPDPADCVRMQRRTQVLT